MFKNVVFALILSYLLIGCAKRPESISASYVAYEKYMNQSCNALMSNLSEARFQLNQVSIEQNTKSNLDVFTVFLTLIPQSSIFGDKAGSVANLKGKVEAIETALVIKKCMPVLN